MRNSGEPWYMEKKRLKDIIDEKSQQLEKLKREEETHRDHFDAIRREVILYSFRLVENCLTFSSFSSEFICCTRMKN